MDVTVFNAQYTLQWGRTCEGAELSHGWFNYLGVMGLQWGRTCEGAELRTRKYEYGVYVDASMGPHL